MKRTYSFICCTHRPEYYRRNVEASLSEADGLHELIPVINDGNRFSVPEALNIGMEKASGDILVFCHHDTVFPKGWIKGLDRQIDQIELKDPKWGVLGIMGVGWNGRHVGSIDDPLASRRMGRLPSRVQSLDEVCLIMRRNEAMRFDENLGGVHFYGADICLQARHGGRSCYAIEAPLQHLSAGTLDEGFAAISGKLLEKWSGIPGGPRSIETTCGVFPLKQGCFSWSIAALKVIRRRVCWKMGSLSDIAHL